MRTCISDPWVTDTVTEEQLGNLLWAMLVGSGVEWTDKDQQADAQASQNRPVYTPWFVFSHNPFSLYSQYHPPLWPEHTKQLTISP